MKWRYPILIFAGLCCSAWGFLYQPFPMPGGDAVLIDESCRSPRSGKIYGLQTPDGPLVKRLRKRKDRWWADSDNDAYKPRPIGRSDRTLGLVVWWAHTER